MKRYKNSKHSGISAYLMGSDYIDIRFHRGGTYRYSYNSAGKHHIEKMKKLAVEGLGLNTYINKFVKDLYE